MTDNCLCLTLGGGGVRRCVCVPVLVRVFDPKEPPYPYRHEVDEIIRRAIVDVVLTKESPHPEPWKTGSITEVVGHLLDPLEKLDIPGVEGGAWSRDIARVSHLLNEINGIESSEIRETISTVLMEAAQSLVKFNTDGGELSFSTS